MKKFALLLAVVCLCVCGVAAQTSSPSLVVLEKQYFSASQSLSDLLDRGAPPAELDAMRQAVVQARRNYWNAIGPADDHPHDGVTIGPNIVCVDHLRAGAVLSHECNHNLKTTWGVDQIAAVMSGAYLGAPFKTINLSTDSTAPDPGDCATLPCTLTGLITTNGLAAQSANYAHTGGTATYTLSSTWTATGTVTNVQKAVVSLGSGLNLCSGYSCGYVFENTFTPVTLNANDQLAITWTITIT